LADKSSILADSDDRAASRITIEAIAMKTGERRRLDPGFLGAVSAVTLALGCGSSGSRNFDDTNPPPSSRGPGASASSADLPDATLSNGDTDARLFMPAATDDDGGIVIQSGACTGGVYQGKFMTYIGAGTDGGASGGLFSFMWNGNLTIDLAAQKITMTSMTGGELPTTTSTSTLEIADGGALDGSDPYGGHFFANLSGSLDCAPDAGPPYRLTATLSNGSFNFSSLISIDIIGHLTADYQEAGVGTPPMLVNGQILIAGIATDGGTPSSSASGSWTATWVSAQ
jgi:hypothetical protein